MMELLHVKDEKKGMEPISLSNAFNVYNLRVLEQFSTWSLCEYLVILI